MKNIIIIWNDSMCMFVDTKNSYTLHIDQAKSFTNIKTAQRWVRSNQGEHCIKECHYLDYMLQP